MLHPAFPHSQGTTLIWTQPTNFCLSEAKDDLIGKATD